MAESDDDAFALKNALPVLVIQVTRLYDVMTALLRTQNETLAKNLVAAHTEGRFFSPPPAYKVEEEDADNTYSGA